MLNTLVHGKPVFMGSLWAVLDPTHRVVYMHNGSPRVISIATYS